MMMILQRDAAVRWPLQRRRRGATGGGLSSPEEDEDLKGVQTVDVSEEEGPDSQFQFPFILSDPALERDGERTSEGISLH